MVVCYCRWWGGCSKDVWFLLAKVSTLYLIYIFFITVTKLKEESFFWEKSGSEGREKRREKKLHILWRLMNVPGCGREAIHAMVFQGQKLYICLHDILRDAEGAGEVLSPQLTDLHLNSG